MIHRPDSLDRQAPISGPVERDAFICAALVCDGLSPLELKTAVRLAIFFNCKDGRCDPGFPRLAKELGVTPRSARRAVAALVAFGIVEEDRASGGGHDNKTKFRLFMPPARVTRPMSPVAACKVDQRRVTGTALTGDGKAPGRVTPRRPHNTEKNTERNTEQSDVLSAHRGLVDRAVTLSTAEPLSTLQPSIRETPKGARLDQSEIDQSKIERLPLAGTFFASAQRNGRAAPLTPEKIAKRAAQRRELFVIMKRNYPQHQLGDMALLDKTLTAMAHVPMLRPMLDRVSAYARAGRAGANVPPLSTVVHEEFVAMTAEAKLNGGQP